MRVLAVGGFVAVAAAAVYMFAKPRPADVYPLPIGEAYQKLSKAKFQTLEDGFTVQLHATKSVSGNGRDRITWNESAMSCNVALAPLPDDAAQTHVAVTCDGGAGAGAGAAAGFAHNLRRNEVIEKIDATLTGRAADPKRIGSTAYRWPGDGVDGSYGTMVKSAIEMDAEQRKFRKEQEAEQKEKQKQASASKWNTDAELSAASGDDRTE